MLSVIVHCLLLAFTYLILADLNFGITHSYLYSALAMMMSALLVYGVALYCSLGQKLQDTREIDAGEFKFYRSKKRWSDNLLRSNGVFLVWMLTIGLLSVSDRYFDRNETIIPNLEVVESGTTSIGRGKGAYVIVRDKGRLVKCRGYFNLLLERDQRLVADLIYSNTLIGFEKTDCKVKRR